MASFSILVFPGSNCDHDAYHAVKQVMGHDARFVWHKETDLGDTDVVVVPGGFSYGDYLRCGAIARFSPVMRSVVDFARKGGLVVGICNGFQILLESGLLPGAMLHNANLKFACKPVNLRVESVASAFTNAMAPGQVLNVPIAHGEGNYVTDADGLKALEDHDQILFRYCDADGSVTDASNPNGSTSNIAGICNRGRNVMGMMPHPERAMEAPIGGTDGRLVFESILAALGSPHPA
jgi:phosphoribosylformylglycinamidine synthase I